MGKDRYIPLSEGIVRLSKAGYIVNVKEDSIGREWLYAHHDKLGVYGQIRVWKRVSSRSTFKQVDNMAVDRLEGKKWQPASK